MPSLDKIYETFNERGLEVLLINLREKQTVVSSFMEENKYAPSVLLDSEGEVAKKFHVMGIPISFLIDKSGQIAFRSGGSVDWKSEKMGTLIEELLEEDTEKI